MRLWHYKLIPVLPDKMLVAQWRECVAIKRQWEKGTLLHPLVKYVINYPKAYFLWYANQVVSELEQRYIKYSIKLYIELSNFCKDNEKVLIENYPEHNSKYLVQCFYNLQEKYDRGILDYAEYDRIEKAVREEVQL